MTEVEERKNWDRMVVAASIASSGGRGGPPRAAGTGRALRRVCKPVVHLAISPQAARNRRMRPSRPSTSTISLGKQRSSGGSLKQSFPIYPRRASAPLGGCLRAMAVSAGGDAAAPTRARQEVLAQIDRAAPADAGAAARQPLLGLAAAGAVQVGQQLEVGLALALGRQRAGEAARPRSGGSDGGRGARRRRCEPRPAAMVSARTVSITSMSRSIGWLKVIWLMRAVISRALVGTPVALERVELDDQRIADRALARRASARSGLAEKPPSQ